MENSKFISHGEKFCFNVEFLEGTTIFKIIECPEFLINARKVVENLFYSVKTFYTEMSNNDVEAFIADNLSTVENMLKKGGYYVKRSTPEELLFEFFNENIL